MTIRDNNHDPLSEYPHLLAFLCYRSATKTIKQQLAAKGERVREYSAMIRALADAYVEDNRPALMVDAILTVQREPSWLRLAESESTRRARERPKLMDPRKALELLEKARKR